MKHIMEENQTYAPLAFFPYSQCCMCIVTLTTMNSTHSTISGISVYMDLPHLCLVLSAQLLSSLANAYILSPLLRSKVSVMVVKSQSIPLRKPALIAYWTKPYPLISRPQLPQYIRILYPMNPCILFTFPKKFPRNQRNPANVSLFFPTR